MADREKLLLDLFTEIAVVEHLVRNHIGQIQVTGLTAGQFGALNYFIRNNREQERKSVLAWMFQVTIEDMEAHLGALEERGLIGRLGEGDDQVIGITAAGRAAHADSVRAMAPEIKPLMAEFADEDLEKTVEVLQEIRRVFDNLPERAAASA
jgi:DNA-binding MarR family transcriptional regulator